jgi:DNA-binding MarR family transcriptional regulator
MRSPVESTVMRFINQNPAISGRAVSDATMLSSSNLARILRGLEEKGLIRRESDLKDARAVRLYLTDLAHANLKLLRNSWSRMLDGLIEDEGAIDLVNGVLRRVDEGLLARRKGQTSTDGRSEPSVEG